MQEAILALTESSRVSDERTHFLRIGKAPLGIGAMTAVTASLCCLSPLLLVVFGVLSISAGIALGDYLYANYKFHFVVAGGAFMLLATLLHLRRGSCSNRADKLGVLSGIALIAIISYIGINAFLTILEVLAKRAIG